MPKCTYVTAQGNCGRDAIPPNVFCEKHSPKAKRTLIGQYLFASKYLDDSLDRHSDTQNLKSLVGEIAVLKSLFESKVNTIQSLADVDAASPSLQTLAEKIEKLVASAHNLDVKLGNLLSKAALTSLAQEIIQIIENSLRPLERKVGGNKIDETVEAVGRQIVEAIAKQENENGNRR